MENLKDQGFRTMLKNQFVKHTDVCVDSFLKGDIKTLFSSTKKLSKVVLNHFKPMIPENFHAVWQKGIDSNDYYLKLCGSGGGGYILGFTQDFEKAKNALKDYKLEVVYQF
jgi:mevalonate kinase